MKKLLITLAVLPAFMACNTDRYVEPGSNEYLNSCIDKYKTTETFNVPIKEGHVTVVKHDGATLYEGNMPVTINIPSIKAGEVSRGADEIECFYIYEPSTNRYYDSYRRGLLLFEDLPEGDNDYNDFICEIEDHIYIHAKAWDSSDYDVTFKKMSYRLVALGNTIPLTFGIELRKKDGTLILEKIIAEDVRADMANGDAGYIHTTGEQAITEADLNKYPVKEITFDPIVLDDNTVGLNYFIIANGKKHYTTEAAQYLKTSGVSYNEVLGKNDTPFGMFLLGQNKEHFAWPLEGKAIWEAYPSFTDWLNGKTNAPFATSVPENLVTFWWKQ